MIFLRSLFFAVFGLAWTILFGVLGLPSLLAPRRWVQEGGRMWCRGIHILAGVCCGLRYRIEGRENLPDGPVIIAAKHQSAWDTLIFHQIADDPVYVLKRELFRAPLIGWYLWKAGNVGIDRKAGFRAIKQMMPAVAEKLKEGAQVIVFPEGTRTAPGVSRKFQPGIAALYERFDVPVVPIALNSGLFWGRRAFLKSPGTITLRVLPPMPSGLPRHAFLAILKQRIDDEVSQLCRADGLSNGAAPPTVDRGMRTPRETRG